MTRFFEVFQFTLYVLLLDNEILPIIQLAIKNANPCSHCIKRVLSVFQFVMKLGDARRLVDQLQQCLLIFTRKCRDLPLAEDANWKTVGIDRLDI